MNNARQKLNKANSKPLEYLGFKGFDNELTGRGFKFTIGKTHSHEGPVILCDSGFHACQNPLDIFDFYPPINGNRFAKVTMRGAMDGSDGAWWTAAELTVDAELAFPALVSEAVRWGLDPSKTAQGQDLYANASCEDNAKNASNESYVANASSGENAINASSGAHAKNASSGDHATNVSSRDHAMNASSGRYAKNASSGDQAPNASAGDHGVNVSSGCRAANASSGDHAINASSGRQADNASSGDHAINASCGQFAVIASSGDYGFNEAIGEYAVIAGAGRDTRYKGARGVWIAAAEYADIAGNWCCVGFAVGRAGHDGVPVDTWLVAKGGKLVCAP